jgi:WD40 repeat protein
MRLLTEHSHPIDKLTFSPDSRWLLATARHRGSDGVYIAGAVRLWDLAAGTSQVLQGALFPVFTPDGRSVLYAERADNFLQLSLRLFGLASGKSTSLTLTGREPGNFWRPLFAPDGSRLLSFGSEGIGLARGAVLYWTAYPSWQPIGEWRLNERFDPAAAPRDILTVAFSPDGKTLAALSERGLMLFDVATGKPSPRPDIDLKQTPHFLAYHPGGRYLALGWGNKVTIFDTRTREWVAEVRQSRKHILSGAFTPDGRCFLTASNEETVKCWDTAGWSLKREYAWEIGALRSVAIAPDGMTAAAGGDSTDIVLFDLED